MKHEPNIRPAGHYPHVGTSTHFEIVDGAGRCAAPFRFTSSADACGHLAQLGSPFLVVAEITVTVERTVRVLGSISHG